MKKHNLAAVIGILGVVSALGAVMLTGCGGGGGGGGESKQITKLFLFGTMSSNSRIATVTTSVISPNFVDYSAPNKSVKGIYSLKTGVVTASGPVQASDVTGSTYDNTTGKLTVRLVNGAFQNMSSSTGRNNGKGTEVATLSTKPGTTFPAADTTPEVGQQRLTTPPSTGYLNGCKVNYAP